MAKLFEKHETLFCMLLIAVYIIVNSLCSGIFGSTSEVSLIVNTLLSAFLIILTLILKRASYYGLKGVREPKRFLYFLPLLVLISVNLWNGININGTLYETVIYILTMINVGFIEELIFRGFLFKMMERNNVKYAVLISSLTFGAGHIINLLNGAELIPTLFQICYASATGYLFVMIFQKSSSLIPCIITHSLVNALSVFNEDNTLSLYIAPVILTAVPLIYAFYINHSFKKNSSPTEAPK